MTVNQLHKIEKMAEESVKYARRAINKSNELRTLLSLMEYRSGKVNHHVSVDQLFKKLKIS